MSFATCASAPVCLSAHYIPLEITPPTLELCPKDEEVTTSTARTEIEKPRVIFRAEDGREMAHTCTHFGERQFYNFTLGSHVIRCKAFNPMFGEDASSVCQFTLTVKRKDSAVKLTFNPNMWLSSFVVLSGYIVFMAINSMYVTLRGRCCVGYFDPFHLHSEKYSKLVFWKQICVTTCLMLT